MPALTRSASARLHARASTVSSAASGTTFDALPARATVAVSVVPAIRRREASRNATKRDSSTSAEAPFSGSRPACAARPRKRTRKTPQPLRATLAAPSSDGSSTSTRRCRRATLTVSSREASEPTSSSGTSSSDTGSARDSRTIAASTAMPTAMPAFMSKTPGPLARPASRRHGISASVPAGQTVSRCPSSSVPPVAIRHRREHGVAPRRARPQLGRHAPLAQAIVDPGGGERHALGVVARALQAHERLQVGDDARQVRVERREPAGRHARQS